jgi:hypothetical protein
LSTYSQRVQVSPFLTPSFRCCKVGMAPAARVQLVWASERPCLRRVPQVHASDNCLHAILVSSFVQEKQPDKIPTNVHAFNCRSIHLNRSLFLLWLSTLRQIYAACALKILSGAWL